MIKFIITARTEMRKILKFKWVVYSFVTTNLKTRYKRSFLGFFWSLLGPLLNYVVVGYVISRVARFESKYFFVEMLFGSLVFNFLNSCIINGGNSFILNESYIKKIYLPKIIYPLSTVLNELVNFVLGISALLLFILIFSDFKFQYTLILLPIPFVVLAATGLGLACLSSVLVVYFRDLAHIFPILMQILFFCTPIIYPQRAVPNDIRWFIDFNPIQYLVEMTRSPIVDPTIFLINLKVSIMIGAVVLITGLIVMNKFRNKIVFKL